MGLLDDNDVPPFVRRGARRVQDSTAEADANFEQLQNLGYKENSEDFSDSPFADRRKAK